MHIQTSLRACLRLYLRNRVFKLKKWFLAKASFLNFCQFFRLCRPLKVLLNFFTKRYFFLQINFLSVIHTFKPFKHALKQGLMMPSLSCRGNEMNSKLSLIERPWHPPAGAPILSVSIYLMLKKCNKI